MDINLELSLGAAQWLTTRDSLEDGQTLPTDNKGQLSMKCLDYIIISHKGALIFEMINGFKELTWENV